MAPHPFPALNLAEKKLVKAGKEVLEKLKTQLTGPTTPSYWNQLKPCSTGRSMTMFTVHHIC